MQNQEFQAVFDEQFSLCKGILVDKAKEYATDEDRLHNFKIVAALQGCTVRDAVVRLMAKHTVSIFDMGRDLNTFPMAKWNEKITDHINYLILLRAVLVEDEKSVKAMKKDDTVNFKSNAVFNMGSPTINS